MKNVSVGNKSRLRWKTPGNTGVQVWCRHFGVAPVLDPLSLGFLAVKVIVTTELWRSHRPGCAHMLCTPWSRVSQDVPVVTGQAWTTSRGWTGRAGGYSAGWPAGK